MKELTQQQRFWLEHIGKAGERGQTLKDYAKQQGLSLGAMYRAKSLLKARGVISHDGHEAGASELVPVRVTPLGPGAWCRLRHPSGWSLECEGWPDPGWLRAVMAGSVGDAAT